MLRWRKVEYDGEDKRNNQCIQLKMFARHTWTASPLEGSYGKREIATKCWHINLQNTVAVGCRETEDSLGM